MRRSQPREVIDARPEEDLRAGTESPLMRQLIQSARHGTVELLEVPAPQLRGPGVLVETAASLISPGTERAAVEFGRASLLGKARSRPDLVRQVIEKARRDGLVASVLVALSRLDRPSAPGYACSGVVVAKTSDLTGVQRWRSSRVRRRRICNACRAELRSEKSDGVDSAPPRRRVGRIR